MAAAAISTLTLGAVAAGPIGQYNAVTSAGAEAAAGAGDSGAAATPASASGSGSATKADAKADKPSEAEADAATDAVQIVRGARHATPWSRLTFCGAVVWCVLRRCVALRWG